MKELKIHVERIVRPIRGTQKRKNKMREELLQHMLTAHDEAVKLGHTDPVAYAVERLGNPDALRKELQDSVPRWERVGTSEPPFPLLGQLEAMLEPGSNAHAKIAFRASAQALIFTLIVLIPFINNWDILAKTFLMMLIMFSLMAVSFFISTYLFRKTGLHRIMHKSSAASPLVKACLETGHWVSIIVLLFVSMAILDGLISFLPTYSSLSDELLILAKQPVIYLGLIIAFVVTYFAMAHDRRQYEEWGHLEIDE